MDLSVIIVNYNVKQFLEPCLFSVERAMKKIEGEVWVVDNNSVDGSVRMVHEQFPKCNLIENKKNLGFSKANNQGIRKASGKYILLLNPDTVVREDTFKRCLHFMETHSQAGAIGVKMIDGKGRFLPESKRAFPTPEVAFFKIFGFARIFPRSPIFNKYNLGFLSEDQIHEVEVLSGAYMFLRKEVLAKTGLLDEDYFMYGEDVDLSFRITRVGYKNYYFPETTIIHYKGESTKKGSLNYVVLFYKAMLIFARKHLAPGKFKILSTMIRAAIYFRASLSMIKRLFSGVLLPALDILLIFLGYFLIVPKWEQFKFYEGYHYPQGLFYIAIPLYIIIWVFSNYLNGAYGKPVHLFSLAKGVIMGTVFILIIYALLPLQFRFSRALILLGSLWAFVTLPVLRIILHFLNPSSFPLSDRRGKRLLIAGGIKETGRIKNLLDQASPPPQFAGFVSVPASKENSDAYLGTFDQLGEMIKIHHIHEIIFCAQDVPAENIIFQMTQLTGRNISFKIAPPGSLSIMGNPKSLTTSDLFLFELNSISEKKNRHNKRLLDVGLSLIFLLFYVFMFLFVNNPSGFLRNIFRVLWGFQSWVGYDPLPKEILRHLPALRQGIILPSDTIKNQKHDIQFLKSLNLMYVKDYKLIQDIKLIIKSYKNLGRQHQEYIEK